MNNNNYYNNSTEEDDLVIADMSGVERPPILNPFPGAMRRSRKDDDIGSELDAEGRRALIGGAVSAGLLVAGVIAAAFAVLIVIITHVWG